MKITVLSDFTPPIREVETKSATLGAFLKELAKELGTSVGFVETVCEEAYPHISVTLNGELWSILTEGMKTRLKDGDRVAVHGTYLSAGG